MKPTSRRAHPAASACHLPLKLISAAVLAACAGGAWALPQGGQLVAGQGSVASSGGAMTVTQQSQNMILNWQGFSIGSGETVRFNQPSSSAVALNRVIGSDPSAILGNLQANGQVFLVNPNGILFGAGARVDVGGLVASTLDIGNTDFNNGRYRFTANNARPAGIVNQGTLTASPGGYIALVGGQVSNQGVISARLGTAALIAGQAATLDFTGTRLMQVRVDGAALGALAENRQLINADGGTVLMTAYARDALLDTVVNNSGIIEARTLDGRSGTIKLLGDFSGGTVKVGGLLDASAPAALNPGGGDGGFIDTSGAHVKVDDSLRISTRAEGGATGTWLIDPANYNIAASGGDMSGAALSNALAASNVTILSSAGAGSGGGDINVKDNVSWSANTLALTAARDINVSAVMSASGTAALTMNTNTANGADAAAGSGYLNMALTPNGFTGRIDYAATGALTINGLNYVVVRDVATLQTMTRGTSFALGSDIDASSVSDFTPLDLGPFSSHTHVQGLGHVVRNYSSSQGGLILQTGGSVQNIGITGNISGSSSMVTGGLAGSLYTYGIRNSFSTANVTATGTYAGGLVGSANEIVNSWATGNVSGDDMVGGLAASAGTIINSWATGNVSAVAYVTNGPAGGLAGQATRVVNSFATGNVTTQFGSNAGGLVGALYNGEIVDSFATGNVSAPNSSAGGLVGSASVSNVIRSYATGAVSGSTGGGLAGIVDGGITDSYATGSVTGASYGTAGGLVGQLREGSTVTRSYASGAVGGSSPMYMGGLVGGSSAVVNSPMITDSFWNVETTGMSQAAGGIYGGSYPIIETNIVGATSAQLAQPATGSFYTANAGSWDFANTWYAGRGTGAGPILRTSPFTVKVTVASASGTAGSGLPTPVVSYSGNLWAGDTAALFSAAPLTSANGSTAGVYDWGATASGTSLTGQQYRFIYDPVTPAPTLTLMLAAAPVSSQPANPSPGYIGALNYVGGSGGAGGGTGSGVDGNAGGAGDAAGDAAGGGAQKGKGSGAQGAGGPPLIGVEGTGIRLPPGVAE